MFRTVSQLLPPNDWSRSTHRSPISGAIYTRFPHISCKMMKPFGRSFLALHCDGFEISSRVTQLTNGNGLEPTSICDRDSRGMASTHQSADMWLVGEGHITNCLCPPCNNATHASAVSELSPRFIQRPLLLNKIHSMVDFFLQYH